MTVPPQVRRTPESWLQRCRWLPPFVQLGQVLVGPGGEVVKVSREGRLELIVMGAQPAESSSAGSRP